MKKILHVFDYKAAFPYVVFVVGIILYTLGLGEYFKADWGYVSDEVVNKILLGFGNLFVVGSIIGFITSYAQNKKLYQNGLEEIIYSEKFLGERKDIEEIWRTVSKVLFKSKFPEITKPLLGIITNKYFPVNINSYYEDLVISIKMSWKDNDKKEIVSENTHSFHLITESTNEMSVPIAVIVNPKTPPVVNIKECFVNGKTTEVKEGNPEKEEIETKGHVEHFVKIKGNNKYKIQYTRERIWDFDTDIDSCYRARYIINRMTVVLNYPIDLEANLICRGTIEDFEDVNSSNGSLVKRYNGLILPRQGYVITFKRKNNTTE